MGEGLKRAFAAARATQSKYRNKPIVVAGIRFASQAEAKRHLELRLLERAGTIKALQRQPRFPLVVSGKTICTYVGDFYYREGDKECVEDVKGFETALFKIKAKLFHALHPTIELRVLHSGTSSLPTRRALNTAIRRRQRSGSPNTSTGG